MKAETRTDTPIRVAQKSQWCSEGGKKLHIGDDLSTWIPSSTFLVIKKRAELLAVH